MSLNETSASSRLLEERLISNASNYDSSVRPNAWKWNRLDAEADEVTVQLMLTSFDIMEFRQAWTARGYFRTWWFDERLAHDAPKGCGAAEYWRLSPDVTIWRPDLEWANLRQWSDREPWNSATYVHPDGLVYETSYTNNVYECEVRVQDMPWDSHECSLKVLSTFGNHVKLLVARPKAVDIAETATNNVWTVDRATGDETLDLLDDLIGNAVLGQSSTLQKSGTETSSGVSLNVHVSRRPRYVIKYAMIPAVLLLLIEYVSFYIDRKAAPARATFIIVPVLTLRLLLNSVFERLETVSYTIYVAEFLNICLCIAILCVVQYGVVHIFLYNEECCEQRRAAHRKLGSRLHEYYDQHDVPVPCDLDDFVLSKNNHSSSTLSSSSNATPQKHHQDIHNNTTSKKKEQETTTENKEEPPPPSPTKEESNSFIGPPALFPTKDDGLFDSNSQKHESSRSKLTRRFPSSRFLVGDPCAGEKCDYSNPIHEIDVTEMRIVFDSYDTNRTGSLGPKSVSRIMKLYGVYIDKRCARDTMLHFRYVTGLPIPINHDKVRLSFAHFQDFVASYETNDIGRDQRNMSFWSKPRSLQVDILSRLTFFPITAAIFGLHYLIWFA